MADADPCILQCSIHNNGMDPDLIVEPSAGASLDIARALATPIKELKESERSLFLGHLIELDAEDRYLRFGSPLSDSAIGAYVGGIDFRSHTVFGVFDDSLKLVAAGHFAPMPVSNLPCETSHPSAEFGLSVNAVARGKGLGTALFLRAASHARNLGIETLFMHCLTQNRPMMRIAKKAGMEIHHASGEADAYLALEPGDAASAFVEAVQRRIAIFDFAVKRQVLAAKAAIKKIVPTAA